MERTERQSNIELFRIVLMLLIIAHHYVVNSGVMGCFDYANPTANMVFAQFFGNFGKIGINCFLLITGYYMVTAKWSWRKWFKLYLEIKFYIILIYAVFILTGFASFNYHEALEIIFSFLFGVGETYSDTFIALYLLIPFINILINGMSKKQYERLLLLLLLIFTLIPTFTIVLSVLDTSNDTWNYLAWMVIMYLVGGYIRIYTEEKAWAHSAKLWFWLAVANVALCFAWIVFYDFFGARYNLATAYWFVNDANKLLAFTTAVAMFMLFKNLNVRHSKGINTVAATTFGVFLIHTNGDYMRTFLWKDIFKCSEAFCTREFALYAVAAVLLVFAVCSVIDLARIYLLEKPVFSFLDKKLKSKVWRADHV